MYHPASAPKKSCKRKHFFAADCGEHMVLCSMDSVSKRAKRQKTLPCKMCQGELKSGCEGDVWHQLQQAPCTANTHIVYEASIVEGSNSPADFSIFCKATNKLLLVVEVDGAQHFTRPRPCSIEQQQQVDNMFDTLAVQQGRHVLRVHYCDIPYFTYWLDRALAQVRRPQPPPFVMYTCKYDMPHRTL